MRIIQADLKRNNSYFDDKHMNKNLPEAPIDLFGIVVIGRYKERGNKRRKIL